MKTWFITGASRGFGRLWIEAALARGDQVVGTARDPSTFGDLGERYASRFLGLRMDVTDANSVTAAFASANGQFGRLDIVVCNAGYGYTGAIEEVVLDEVRSNFDTNVIGVIATIQAALPYLRAQGAGHILTVSSIGGIVSFPTGGVYTGTKHAVEAISEALAGEVRSFGIKVTIIEPGSFRTTFRNSMTHAQSMPEYEPVRKAVMAGFDASLSGNPDATPAALFALVDSAEPPLRLILGNGPLPQFKKAYQARIAEWERWRNVSDAAQGVWS